MSGLQLMFGSYELNTDDMPDNMTLTFSNKNGWELWRGQPMVLVASQFKCQQFSIGQEGMQPFQLYVKSSPYRRVL